MWLSANTSVTWEVVQNMPDKPWFWTVLSMNRSITWDVVEANTDKPWDYLSENQWEVVEANPSITWEVVRANQSTRAFCRSHANSYKYAADKTWNWYLLCRDEARIGKTRLLAAGLYRGPLTSGLPT